MAVCIVEASWRTARSLKLLRHIACLPVLGTTHAVKCQRVISNFFLDARSRQARECVPKFVWSRLQQLSGTADIQQWHHTHESCLCNLIHVNLSWDTGGVVSGWMVTERFRESKNSHEESVCVCFEESCGDLCLTHVDFSRERRALAVEGIMSSHLVVSVCTNVGTRWCLL